MIIGVTGGIGSGKSVVSRYISNHGYKLVDADSISREITQPDCKAYDELIEAFGNSILDTDGTINRQKLRSLTFNNNENYTILDKIVTDNIIQVSSQRLSGDCVYDVPLLFEKNLSYLVDVVIVVTSDIDLRINRVIKRNGWTRDDVLNIINNQIPEEDKIKRADYVIFNNGTLEELEKKIEDVLNDIKQNIRR